MLEIAVFGMMLGVIFSLPAGPVALKIVENSLVGGKKAGFTVLLGMMAAELVYYGIFLTNQERLVGFDKESLFYLLFSVLGGGFILLTGLRSHRSQGSAKVSTGGGVWAFSATILNPAVLVFLLSVTTLFVKQFGAEQRGFSIMLLSYGIGTILWFSLLILLSASLGPKLEHFVQHRLRPVTSVLFMGIGGWMIGSSLINLVT